MSGRFGGKACRFEGFAGGLRLIVGSLWFPGRSGLLLPVAGLSCLLATGLDFSLPCTALVEASSSSCLELEGFRGLVALVRFGVR